MRSVEPPSWSLREALLRAGLKTVDELHQKPLQPGARGTLDRLCEMIWLRGIAGDHLASRLIADILDGKPRRRPSG